MQSDGYADYNLGKITSDTGFGLSGAVGKSRGNFDFELEFAYKESDLDGIEISNVNRDMDGTFKIKTLMANSIYNFKSDSVVSPYFGAGLGIARVEIRDDSYDREFAYQILAGMSMEMNDKVSMLLGYRYFGMDDISEDYTSHETSIPVSAHNFELGVKYSF